MSLSGDTAILKVGDTLYYKPYHGRGRAEEYTVAKIGRTWITLEQHGRTDVRIEKESGRAEIRGGYSLDGDLYLSEEHYREEMQRRHIWFAIASAVSGRPPTHVPTPDLLDIARKLRLADVINSFDFKALAEKYNATED